jgi:hypothetical protein
MIESDKSLPFIYVGNRLTVLERTSSEQDSFFGGPLELKTGSTEPVRLHRTLTICASHLSGENLPVLLGSIPLIYAFQHEQNQIEYRLRGNEIPGQGLLINEQAIDHLSLDTSTYSPEWPYRHYPPIFPLINLAARELGHMEPDEFRDRFLPQVEWGSTDAIVGLPTNRTLGFSMWGLEGDKQGIVLLFRVDLKDLSVVAWHWF